MLPIFRSIRMTPPGNVYFELCRINSTMKALKCVKKCVCLVEIAVPCDVRKHDVRIKVAYAGVCGSDLHYIKGTYPCSDNVILGHEFCGTVDGFGSGVTHVKCGDKVAVDPNSGCGVCKHCTDGNYHYCQEGALKMTIGVHRNGGWANYCVVPARQVFKLPEKMSLKQGMLAEKMSYISHGFDLIQPTPSVGKKIVILGAGIVGKLWACLLHHRGYMKVMISEPLEARRKLAAKLELKYEILSPDEIKFQKELNCKWGAHIVIDCSGNVHAMEEAVEMLKHGGQLAIHGTAPAKEKMKISPMLLQEKEIRINGILKNPHSFNKSLQYIKAMGDRYLNYEKLGIKEFKLEGHKEAIDELKTGCISEAVFTLS